MLTGDTTDVQFGLGLLDRATDHAYCQIILVLSRPWNCGTCDVGQVIRSTPSNMLLVREVNETQLCGYRLVTASVVLLALRRSRLELPNPIYF